MTPLTKLTRIGSRRLLGGISLAIIAAVPAAAQGVADPLRQSPINGESRPLGGADRGSVQSTLKTETEIIRSLAPFADGNPVIRPRAPRAIDTDRGRVRVDYSRAIDITVFFDYDSAQLTEEAGVQLEPLGRALQSRELLPYRFLIAGHTDASGDPAYNRSLSLKRAATVRAYLSKTYGVDPLRLVIHGWGQSRLKDPANPFSRINRRVEIALIMPNTAGGDDYEGFGTREFAADIVPGRRLLVDENGAYVRIVNAPDVAQWRDVACRGPVTAVGGHLLSDPRWRLSRFALDDFGATPTAPCRGHGANIRFETGGFGADYAAPTYTFPFDHRFGRRGSDAD
jgi:outer membrane protein OmpA-like peptidoglycan-associated protein